MHLITRLIVVTLVLLAASGLFWVDTLRRQPIERPQDAQDVREPDYYFVDLMLRRYERVGPPVYTLDAQRMTHFASDDTAELTGPALDYRKQDGRPWHIESQRGHVGPAGARIELIQDVEARRRPADGAPINLRTSRLSVYPNEGRAQTERPVEASGPGWQKRAIGMTAWFDQDRIELDSEVRSHYDPTTTR